MSLAGVVEGNEPRDVTSTSPVGDSEMWVMLDAGAVRGAPEAFFDNEAVDTPREAEVAKEEEGVGVATLDVDDSVDEMGRVEPTRRDRDAGESD